MTTEALEVFTTKSLVAMVPGSTRVVWWTKWIPELIHKRVLVKRGKAWLGRRSQIEAALLSSDVTSK